MLFKALRDKLPPLLISLLSDTRALNLNCNDSDSTLKCVPLHSIRFSGIVSDAPDECRV